MSIDDRREEGVLDIAIRSFRSKDSVAADDVLHNRGLAGEKAPTGYVGAVHLGVATQTPNGLMVPVVRHAETLGLYACAREMRRVSDAARQGVAELPR